MSSTILMIRPVSFGFNEQTAESNAFQNRSDGEKDIQAQALQEFNAFVDKLRHNGVDVIVIDDTVEPHTPDSIFPNNWISFHDNGDVFLYPMQAENRRLERRKDIIHQIESRFTINKVEDMSHFEDEGHYLEGTGSLVLDYKYKTAYACLSPRTDKTVIDEFCKKSGYEAVCFHAFDGNNKAIYHTNVLMCIGERFVVICLDAVRDEQERALLKGYFNHTHKEIVEISRHQLNDFAGNMLELVNNKNERLLVMSARAYQSLTAEQVNCLEKYCHLLTSDLSVIENIGGGSARCMLAEVRLSGLKS